MRERIQESGFIKVSLDVGNLDHTFVLANTEAGIVLVDSYHHYRPLQISYIDVLS